MITSEPDKKRVTGSLRPAFDEPVPAKPKRPASNTFGRMKPAPCTTPADARMAPAVLAAVPNVRRRRRPSGIVIPVLVGCAGAGAGYVVQATVLSLPIALVCAGVGLIGAVFCHVLLRDRVEIG
jgi:hypothetical protein